jgi:hypothetical protein
VSSLSVLCITADPGAQVAAVLTPLRDVADEVVIAADSRVSDGDLAVYAAACDRLLLYEFAVPVERPYAWAHDRCESDWVLRIDGDEVLSPALIARLPDLIARRDRLQYWLPRRWCHPDAGHWLAERPWRHDHQLRLVRNDPATLSFPGLMHSAAVPTAPFELLEEPMYHLDLLLRTRAERERKAAEYEALRPGLVAAGGGPQNLFYVPERWARQRPATTPPQDAEHIRRVLEPRDAPSVPVVRAGLPVGTRADIDARWDGRGLSDDDYAATLRPLDAEVHLAPAEPDTVLVAVTNRGTTTWPGGLERDPAVRLGHRWLRPDGEPLGGDTPRSGLPSAVLPGETVIAPLTVVAPSPPGAYRLEIDVVHEAVRWFGAAVSLPVDVRPRAPRVRFPRIPRR